MDRREDPNDMWNTQRSQVDSVCWPACITIDTTKREIRIERNYNQSTQMDIREEAKNENLSNGRRETTAIYCHLYENTSPIQHRMKRTHTRNAHCPKRFVNNKACGWWMMRLWVLNALFFRRFPYDVSWRKVGDIRRQFHLIKLLVFNEPQLQRGVCQRNNKTRKKFHEIYFLLFRLSSRVLLRRKINPRKRFTSRTPATPLHFIIITDEVDCFFFLQIQATE